jgi:hypothetical protein
MFDVRSMTLVLRTSKSYVKKSLPKWQLFSRGTRFEGVDLSVLNKINRIHKKAYVL